MRSLNTNKTLKRNNITNNTLESQCQGRLKHASHGTLGKNSIRFQLASHFHAIVGTIMVGFIADEDVGHSANDTVIIGIVLT